MLAEGISHKIDWLEQVISHTKKQTPFFEPRCCHHNWHFLFQVWAQTSTETNITLEPERITPLNIGKSWKIHKNHLPNLHFWGFQNVSFLESTNFIHPKALRMDRSRYALRIQAFPQYSYEMVTVRVKTRFFSLHWFLHELSLRNRSVCPKKGMQALQSCAVDGI